MHQKVFTNDIKSELLTVINFLVLVCD